MSKFILYCLLRWCEADIVLLRDQLATMRRNLDDLEARRQMLLRQRLELEAGHD